MIQTSLSSAIAAGIAAARCGDTEPLLAWLQAGHDPNAHDADGWTPLLAASVRGHAEAVQLLLSWPAAPADPALRHGGSDALSLHMAGHSGDVRTTEALLVARPDHLDAVWDLNGHTVLLQAVFYGHLDLAQFLLSRGASTVITTARGLGPMELAAQFQNAPMMGILRPFDAPAEAKAAYYRSYLTEIAVAVPDAERDAQAAAEELYTTIASGLERAAHEAGAVDGTLQAVRELVEVRGTDVNRLAGPLQQPPLIVAVTGNNGFPPNPWLARLREALARYLLEKGADPTRHERHPMGAQTIIRAAVFNHLTILRMCADYLTPERLADAINEVPVVNGLTAMHDTVLRASTAAPDRLDGYVEQARWFIDHGGRYDLEDFAGRTQRQIAEQAPSAEARRRLLALMP